MPKFIRLARLTEQGTKNIKNFKQMVSDAQKIMQEHGITMEAAYYTMGPYDVIAVVDAPDAATAAHAGALIASQGNFRAETIPALPLREFAELVGK
jgi:uncharacterized protein with GYD domain